MNKAIIFQNDDGGISITRPTLNTSLTVEQVAAKDVPPLKKYKIVSESELPLDKSDRDRWSVDESDLTDGVGFVDSQVVEMLSKINMSVAMNSLIAFVGWRSNPNNPNADGDMNVVSHLNTYSEMFNYLKSLDLAKYGVSA